MVEGLSEYRAGPALSVSLGPRLPVSLWPRIPPYRLLSPGSSCMFMTGVLTGVLGSVPGQFMNILLVTSLVLLAPVPNANPLSRHCGSCRYVPCTPSCSLLQSSMIWVIRDDYPVTWPTPITSIHWQNHLPLPFALGNHTHFRAQSQLFSLPKTMQPCAFKNCHISHQHDPQDHFVGVVKCVCGLLVRLDAIAEHTATNHTTGWSNPNTFCRCTWCLKPVSYAKCSEHARACEGRTEESNQIFNIEMQRGLPMLQARYKNLA